MLAVFKVTGSGLVDGVGDTILRSPPPSASPVGGIAEWIEQQRDMVVLLVVVDLEVDLDIGIEAVRLFLLKIRLDHKDKLVNA